LFIKCTSKLSKVFFNSAAGIILVFHQGKETFLLFFFVVFDSLHGTEAAFPVSKTSQTNFFSFFLITSESEIVFFPESKKQTNKKLQTTLYRGGLFYWNCASCSNALSYMH
jgi:hypothetical protein